MRRNDQARLALLGLLLGAMAAAVFARLAWVQVIHRERYENPTGINYHRQYRLPARKGELLDRESRPLARCAQVASVAANPQLVSDPGLVASLLSPLLSLPKQELESQLRRRWRRQMLRRGVSRTVESRLALLAQAGIVTFTDEPSDPTFSLYVFPRQFQPAPTERAQLAVILGVDPAELNALLGSEAGAIRYQDNLDPATAKRVDQLALAGLLVQQNPVHLVRAAWLEAGSPSIDEVPVDPARPGPRGADWIARIKPEAWASLAPLWEGSQPPAKEVVEAKLRAPFVYLAREIPLEVGEAVEAVIKDHDGLEGISVHREYMREYPQGDVARLLLGRADVDERGVSGLESLYNQILTGVDGYRKVTVSALGRPIMQEREELVPPVHGKNVELTIDAVVQGYAEEAMARAVADNDADWGLAVVVDPTSGEVLAMADAASKIHDVPPMNRGLAVAYEPGSIVKPLVVAGALEAGLTQPHEVFYCGGRTKVGRKTLRCIKEHGPETVADAVRDSCNMVMIDLAERMRQDRLERNFRGLGLLSRTGLGLQGQEAIGGIFENSEDGRWSIQKVATVSYGKGIQGTAVGLARAYCSLLNGGTLPRLHLVRRIREQDGAVVVEQPVEPGPRLYSERTTRQVREMLREVVQHEEGTGRLAASELYDLGGKTGTSIAYDADDQRVVSFVGFAPYEKPRLLVLVSVAEPRAGMRWGSTTCGPAAREILEKGLQYLGVPPKPPAPREQAP